MIKVRTKITDRVRFRFEIRVQSVVMLLIFRVGVRVRFRLWTNIRVRERV